MGHSLSAEKRERQNVKRRHRNRGNTIVLKKELKRVDAEAKSGALDPQKALAAYSSALDVAARKNAIPKNRANRKKSRLAKALAKAAKATQA